jgi:hypothetical protein
LEDDLLSRLNLTEEDGDEFAWEEELEDPPKKAGIAKVHTSRGFSPITLHVDMHSSWNLAKDVASRKIQDNIFMFQFTWLGDWNKTTIQGPWFFDNPQV